MGVTISTHNGSAVRREHNVRNPKVVSKESHIDPSGSHETWIDEPIRQAYERLFGTAVEAYNERQSRPERKIDSYYNVVCKDSKKHPVYEMIVGIYGKNEDGTPICPADQAKNILWDFVRKWRKRNPNLELIGAYYHADEQGEPHVHLDYVPVAHGYKKGLEVQTGLVKALGEQGFTKKGKETAQIQWERRENDYLTNLCEAVGLQVEHPRIEEIKHLDTAEYKLKKRIEELEAASEQQQSKYADLALRASEAEARAEAAEQKAKGAEARAAAAEQKLEVANAQIEVASEELGIILDKKARASEIRRSLFDRETQSYHANMLESTRRIGNEATLHMKEANEAKQEAIRIRNRAERKEKAIAPLYEQAEKDQKAAQAERKKQERLTRNEKEYIAEQAEYNAEQKIQTMFNVASSRRNERLERFCESIKLSNGKSALDVFEEQEQALKSRSRGRSR